MVRNTFIFIPDISGFSKFVNETDVLHSEHIIRELLETVINSNELDLQVNEIEGDAILFFRSGDPPDPDQIAGQIRKMFIAFHTNVRQIERERVCQCGACSTAVNLTLKFILHYGEVTISNISGHEKLLGKDVILAHRLLKNNVSDMEYMLLTQNLALILDKQRLANACRWETFNDGKINYEHIGEVNYLYLGLTPLRVEIPELAHKSEGKRFRNPIVIEEFIQAPMKLVYKTIIDLDKRPLWIHGLKNIEYNRDKIPRIGSRHICEVPGGKLEIETIHSNLKDGVMEYAERTISSRLLNDVSTFFALSDKDRGTVVKMEFHYQRKAIIGGLLDLFLRPKIESDLSLSSENLKRYCESVYGNKS